MQERRASPIWWVLFGVGVTAVLALGLSLMPRVLAATTYVPPTPTQVPPTPVPPTEVRAAATSAPVEPSPRPEPTPFPTTALALAPDFTLPGAKGTSVMLTDELAEGPVVLLFFARVGG